MYTILYRTKKNNSSWTPWMVYKRYKNERNRDKEFWRVKSITTSPNGLEYEFKRELYE